MGRKSREKWERRAAKEAAAEARRVAAVQGLEDGLRRGCLFCRRKDGGFTSREHVFPESIGNTEIVLPAGVVCDRCNHEVCSQLDAALCDFAPVTMMRTVHGLPSKRGRIPAFKFDNGELRAGGPGELFLDLDSAKWSKPEVRRPDGRVEWGFTTKRQDMTPRRLSKVHRALVKIALERAWLDHGEERLLTPEFDRERSIVLNGGHAGFLVMPKNGSPDGRSGLDYRFARRRSDGAPLMQFVAQVCGVPFVTDTLFAEPQVEVPEDDFTIARF